MTDLTSYLSSYPRPGAVVVVFLAIPAPVFWPYFLGLVVLALGLVSIIRELLRERGLDKLVHLGRLFYAFPIAVFAGEHFTVTKEIASLIPNWISAHMFWTYLVGGALLAAALSFVVERVSTLAGTLLGSMFLIFVLVMDLPAAVANPRDRFAIALALRELSFSAGAFALASTQVKEGWGLLRRMTTIARYVVGVTMIFYGVEHFLHPQNVPVVPLELLVPAWIPLHSLWAYPVGAALLAAGLCMVTNWNARLAAAWMGTVAFAVVLLIYLPMLVAKPADIGTSMNYFADTLMMAGTFLLVARALSKPAAARGREDQQESATRSRREDLPIASGQ